MKYQYRLTLMFRSSRMHDGLEIMNMIQDGLVECDPDDVIEPDSLAIMELIVQDLSLVQVEGP